MKESTPAWPRVEEPLRFTLARTVGIAAVVGAVFALRQGELGLLLPVAAIALWFSLGGHYVEIAFLNGLRPRLPRSRATQVIARLVVWVVGGTVLYLCMVATARSLGIVGPPLRLWWLGGVAFVGVELVAHVILALRGRPNFYDGRG